MRHRDTIITAVTFAIVGAVGALVMTTGPGRADGAAAGAARAADTPAVRSSGSPATSGTEPAAASATPTASPATSATPPAPAGPETASAAPATSPAPRSASRIVRGPAHQLAAVPATVDLGTVALGDSVSVEVALTNHGRTPVSIVDVRTTCGCTAAILDDRRLEPGADVTVVVTFDAERTGRQERLVRIVTEGSRGNVLTVPIRASVVSAGPGVG